MLSVLATLPVMPAPVCGHRIAYMLCLSLSTHTVCRTRQVPTFLAGLRDAGACAVRADAYETALGREAAGAELLRELGREPSEDVAIAFSSIAEVCATHLSRSGLG